MDRLQFNSKVRLQGLAEVMMFLIVIAFLILPVSAESQSVNFKSGYAKVNGLNLYYEVKGTGRPILLLHGSYMTIEGPMRKLANAISDNRQVILVELQGHGRTADIDREITYEALAEDIAAFIKFLKLPSVDVFGYSLGGGVAVQLAIRYPQLVQKVIMASSFYNTKGAYQSYWDFVPTMTVEMFKDSPYKKEYDSLAPNPQDFGKLFSKLKKLDMLSYDWKSENIKAIKSPFLLVIGDSDLTKPEHAVEMFRLLGGGVMGDFAGLPKSQLAVLPGTTHVGVMYQTNLLAPMITTFLDRKE